MLVWTDASVGEGETNAGLTVMAVTMRWAYVMMAGTGLGRVRTARDLLTDLLVVTEYSCCFVALDLDE